MPLKEEFQFRTLKAKNDKWTLAAISTSTQRQVYLHSRVDPQKEAQAFAQKALGEIDTNNLSLLILLGLGLGYHAKALKDILPASVPVLVIEKEKQIYSLCPAENYQDVQVFVNPGESELENIIQKMPTARVQIIMHRPSADLFREYYDELFKQIQTLLSHKDINIATLTRFEEIWLRNFLNNLPAIFSARPLGLILDAKNPAKGLKAALVGAGPSLNAVIGDLIEYQEQIFIACVDTALKPLLDNGIRPDIVFTVDAQFVNSLYLVYCPSEIPLVAEPTCHPLSLRKWPGEIYFFSSPFHYVQWAEKFLGSFGPLKHGGSVSTNAFDFLVQADFDEIYLVGQDLAFVQNRAHAMGTILDEKLYSVSNRIHTREKSLAGQLYALPPIPQTGMDGSSTFTNQKLYYFKKWFDKEISASKRTVKNTSAWGLKIANAPYGEINQLKLSRASNKKEHPFVQRLRTHSIKARNKNSAYFKKENVEKLLSQLALLRDSISELMPLLDKGIEAALKLKNLARKNANTWQKKPDPTISQTLAKLDEIDRQINKFQNTNELLSPAMQKTIQPIIEGAKDFLTDEERKNPLLESAALTLHLYKGMKESMSLALYSINKGLHLAKPFFLGIPE